jgi:hypothetical protein
LGRIEVPEYDTLTRVKRGARIRMCGLLVCLAASAAATTSRPSVAHAQTTTEIATAKQWFAQGLKLEEAGSWKEALERFKRAAAIKKTAQIAFHIGLCEARSGALVSALVDLDRAASLARETHVPDVESAAQAEANDVRARVPTLQIDPPAGTTPVRVLLDGAVIALAMLRAPMPIDPGDHVVAVEFASGRAEKKVTAVERDAIKVPVEPPAPDSASTAAGPPPSHELEYPEAPPPKAAPPAPPSAARGKTAGFTLIGGSILAVVAGTVFWVLRGHEISALDDACPSRKGCDPSLKEHDTNGRIYSTVGIALFGVGAVTLAAGGGILIFGGGSPNATARLAPAALPGGGGAQVVGHF